VSIPSPLPRTPKRTFSQELQAWGGSDEEEEEEDVGGVMDFSSIADRTLRPDDEERDEERSENGFEVFQQGERLEVGALHAGCTVSALDLPAKGSTASPVKRLEIVRKLGSGSYAVVYLCRAVIYDPYEDGGDYDDEEEVVYGQEFALKCLSKKDLSDDLLNVQKFEATLHHSLPAHKNIVALHGAFETNDWLFLILEYCPGQDLFYWLEQARDHEDVEDMMHPSASFQHAGKIRASSRLTSGWQPESHSATPPSPSLLSMTAMNQLLSRRRLRLISRMFIQMCDAVDACHRIGVSHRDIKPENFICCEEDSTKGLERRVMVKITDWGLGTRDPECTDFDCGSKPYMAYECRNNLGPTYRPQQADIWSLGIVFLNLLFHRCPWSDPSMSDPDFVEYCRDPVKFLNGRFEGIGPEVSKFLALRVLNCEGPRASAAELSAWAARLVNLMSDVREATLVSEAAVPLKATRPTEKRLSAILSESSSTRPSPRSSLLAQYMMSMPTSPATVSPSSPPPISPPAHDPDLPADLRATLAVQDLTLGDLATRVVPVLAEPIPASPSLGLGLVTSPTPQTPSVLEQRPELQCAERTVSMGESEAAVLAAKAKRRKRGARRGRSQAQSGQDHQEVQEVSTLAKDEASIAGRVQQLDQLADASQRLARELSKQPTKNLQKPKSTNGLVGRFKGSVSGGHAGLEALAAQKQKRETRWNNGTYSAPADMQHPASATSSTGSASSFGTNSWSAGESSHAHWGSTSARRQRQASRFNPESQSVSTHSYSTSTSTSPSRLSQSTSNVSSPISSVASKSSSYSAEIEQTTQPIIVNGPVVKSVAPSVTSSDSAETIPATPKAKMSRFFKWK